MKDEQLCWPREIASNLNDAFLVPMMIKGLY